MASIADKIQHLSIYHLFMYKEGVFWVAYEQSAYFMARYKGYKPTKKYYKIIKNSAVSVGFPNADKLVNELLINNYISEVHKTDTSIEILLQEPINKIAFEDWKEKLSENVSSQSNSKESIEALVKAFPLAQKTPMEAFLFLKEIQELI
ncbi:hypothetical protein [Flavobacterium sp.]|uniref:hypothetical protein n=1 Tax=Flavobacterium sp. TaxID=239 RepID=UPI00404736DC